jgi:hypothetical protein
MRKLATLAAITCALATFAAHAEMLGGSDDPDYRAALNLALNTGEPEAVARLKALAETGNPAALVALPFALQWIPPTGSLAEKNAQRKLGGIWVQDAAAETHAATALWANGQNTDAPDDLLRRAAGLSALGEPEKAALLLASWVNQTGAVGALPEALFAPDTPAWLGALALTFRLGLSEPSAADHDLLAALLAKESPAAWMALDHLVERLQRDHASLGDPLGRAEISPETAATRLKEAQAMTAVSPSSWRELPVSADEAMLARTALAGRGEFAPVKGLCRVHCPDSSATCETAVLTYPGLLFGHFESTQPFRSVLSADDFYASARGLAALIPLRRDPAAAADRATAESLDACYAALLARRDTLGFGP